MKGMSTLFTSNFAEILTSRVLAYKT